MATTGFTFPGTVTSEFYGPKTWDGTLNDIKDIGGGEIAANQLSISSDQTYMLRCSNFGFAIPSGSTIDLITARYGRYASTDAADPETVGAFDSLVQRGFDGSVLGSNQSGSEAWDYTLEVKDFAHANWGSSPFTADEWNDARAGIYFACYVVLDGTGSFTQAIIDYMQLKIDYTAPVGGTPRGRFFKFFQDQADKFSQPKIFLPSYGRLVKPYRTMPLGI